MISQEFLPFTVLYPLISLWELIFINFLNEIRHKPNPLTSTSPQLCALGAWTVGEVAADAHLLRLSSAPMTRCSQKHRKNEKKTQTNF